MNISRKLIRTRYVCMDNQLYRRRHILPLGRSRQFKRLDRQPCRRKPGDTKKNPLMGETPNHIIESKCQVRTSTIRARSVLFVLIFFSHNLLQKRFLSCFRIAPTNYIPLYTTPRSKRVGQRESPGLTFTQPRLSVRTHASQLPLHPAYTPCSPAFRS